MRSAAPQAPPMAARARRGPRRLWTPRPSLAKPWAMPCAQNPGVRGAPAAGGAAKPGLLLTLSHRLPRLPYQAGSHFDEDVHAAEAGSSSGKSVEFAKLPTSEEEVIAAGLPKSAAAE